MTSIICDNLEKITLHDVIKVETLEKLKLKFSDGLCYNCYQIKYKIDEAIEEVMKHEM